ncbi:conjugal transfer protein TraN [Klebsiella pneumoniae]|uniref:conjugal transfer protein TraN n=1 Tax=Klebsiella pneumoniae TaxID=573 RepID=UPI0009BAE399|nr:conjugal transfer protein TraN [Klebsiella pneumoniae]HAT7496391.1 conjugal transfer protein TraN [Raoultella ornithinolytica]SLS75679.1 conjugal transfer mating pair stabilization protein TraN [Klebsiella pneumoniae]SLS84316.1 conjugal transfer mating pair stabilization protein TraN [Klebsiella pneumoniae]SLS92021.1 conjugal transfer mating pair stabilization protein TraN [Klebsiella pneumoniae]SLS93227.1 conjugal transfer mating pair stabilization protein TraN [Klebsiella pneumoniae]
MKKIISLILSVSIITNTLSWAYYVTLINMVLTPRVYAANEIYESLENTFDLSNPAANRTATVTTDDILEKYNNSQNGSYTEKLNSYDNTGSSSVDMSKYSGKQFSNEDVLNFAKTDGADIAGTVSLPKMSGNNITINGTENGGKLLSRNEDGSISISPNPNAGGRITGTNTGEMYSSEQKNADVQFNADDSYGDEKGFVEDIKNRKSQLFTANSYDGQAYRSLVSATKSNPIPNISPNDPMFTSGRSEIANAAAGTGQWLQNCSTQTTTSTIDKHTPDYKEYYCNAPKKDNYSSCTITREFSVPVYISGGNGDLSVCGDNCIRVWFGRHGDDYFDEGVHENSMSLHFHQDAVIKSAKIVSAEWDDHMQVKIDNTQIFAHIDGEYRDPGYGSPRNGLERKTSNKLQEPIDVTEQVKKSVYDESDNEVEMSSTVWVGGKGEGYFEVELIFENIKLEDKHIQEPAGCYEAVKKTDSFCRFDRFNDLDVGTKRLPQSILQYASPLYDGDTNNITWKTNLEGYFCDPLGKEKLCQYDASGNILKDADGNDACYNYDDIKTMPDACSKYSTNSSCSMSKQSCAEGWFDEGTNQCYMYEQKWTCDEGTTRTVTITNESNTCIGMIPCSGGTCNTGANEENKDFGKVVAYTSMVQNMQGDAMCSDPNDSNSCIVFSGEKQWCGRSVGFVNGLAKTDCCEAPEGAAGKLEAIILAGTMLRNTNWSKISAKLTTWTGGESGTWASMTNSVGQWTSGVSSSVGQMWQRVTEPLTSVYESVTGNVSKLIGSTTVEGGGSAAATELTKDGLQTGGLAAIKQQLMNKAYDMLPDAIRDFVFDKTASAAGQAVFSSAVTNFMLALNVIGWIYTAYQITKMLLEMLLACDQKEMEASIHKNQGACFVIDTDRCVKYLNVGFTKKCIKKATDMCCYNSLLSRVIMQQAYPQLGINPIESGCVGLTISQVQQLDWDKIDMTEYIESAVVAGEVPDEYATFTESSVANMGPYKNDNAQLPSERALESMGGDVNMTKAREENTQALKAENVDCSYLPRPAICDVGSVYTDPITGAIIK